MDDERAPICPVCGVTTVPSALSANAARGDWICLECEETGDADVERPAPKDGPSPASGSRRN